MGAARLLFLCRELEVGAMAQRGRKPKPTALKMLEGNPGGRPLNTKEPRPEKKAPRCPSWLEDEAKKDDVELVRLDSEDLREFLSKEEMRVYSQFKYEEALPFSLDEWVNNYNLERFIYTGSLTEINNKNVYCLVVYSRAPWS